MKIAVIPARGGSKRIPRKNIRNFAGKPMIAHAISAAINSTLFDHVIVSTDDDEIASIACEWGANVPFMRPPELSDDFTTTAPVIAHSIQACRAKGWDVEVVCCIYPGVPFIEISDLAKSLDLMESSGSSYSFPVAEYPSAIQRALKRLPDGIMQPFYPEHQATRTQDLEAAFFDAGQFYWGKADAWLGDKRAHGHGVGLTIPLWRVVDIDTTEDWQRAELLYEVLKRKGNYKLVGICLVRCEYSETVGYGHLVRCLTLAGVMKKHGLDVWMLSSHGRPDLHGDHINSIDRWCITTSEIGSMEDAVYLAGMAKEVGAKLLVLISIIFQKHISRPSGRRDSTGCNLMALLIAPCGRTGCCR